MPSRQLPSADVGYLKAMESASFKLATLKLGERRILASDAENTVAATAEVSQATPVNEAAVTAEPRQGVTVPVSGDAPEAEKALPA